MRLDAFNLIPGCVFRPQGFAEGTYFVARHVERNADDEELSILSWEYLPWERNAQRRFVKLHYTDRVTLIGISVNPEDPGDENYGV